MTVEHRRRQEREIVGLRPARRDRACTSARIASSSAAPPSGARSMVSANRASAQPSASASDLRDAVRVEQQAIAVVHGHDRRVPNGARTAPATPAARCCPATRASRSRPHSAIGGWPALTYRIWRSSGATSAAIKRHEPFRAERRRGPSTPAARRPAARSRRRATRGTRSSRCPVSIAAETPWPETSAISSAPALSAAAA